MSDNLTPEAVAKMLERLSDSLEIEAADMMEAIAAKLAEVEAEASNATAIIADMMRKAYVATERAEAAEAEVARLRGWTPTDDQVASACLSYRHDFGLMDNSARDGLMWQAKEWLRAWRKEFAALQPKETDQ
jgi:hypothetical protein